MLQHANFSELPARRVVVLTVRGALGAARPAEEGWRVTPSTRSVHLRRHRRRLSSPFFPTSGGNTRPSAFDVGVEYPMCLTRECAIVLKCSGGHLGLGFSERPAIVGYGVVRRLVPRPLGLAGGTRCRIRLQARCRDRPWDRQAQRLCESRPVLPSVRGAEVVPGRTACRGPGPDQQACVQRRCREGRRASSL